MKILLKNATLLPEYGYGSALVHILVKDKKIKEIYTELPVDLAVNETVDCGGNLLIPAFIMPIAMPP